MRWLLSIFRAFRDFVLYGCCVSMLQKLYKLSYLLNDAVTAGRITKQTRSPWVTTKRAAMK